MWSLAIGPFATQISIYQTPKQPIIFAEIEPKTGKRHRFIVHCEITYLGLFTKKSRFRVQRVAVIVASRGAAFFFFFVPIFLLCLVGKYWPFLEKKKIAKTKTSPVGPFFSHSAAPPERDFFKVRPQRMPTYSFSLFL